MGIVFQQSFKTAMFLEKEVMSRIFYWALTRNRAIFSTGS